MAETEQSMMMWLWFGGWLLIFVGCWAAFGLGVALVLAGGWCLTTFAMLLKRHEEKPDA